MKQNHIEDARIPDYVKDVSNRIQEAGYEAYIVGGCVRDLVLGREPKDWDITTNAKPEDVQAIFEKTVYENRFGTVAVCIPTRTSGTKPDGVISSTESGGGASEGNASAEDVTLIQNISEVEYYIVEVTTYRKEAGYSDNRHPDKIEFSKTIEEDLMRRDFTMNALAYDISKGHLKDIYGGLRDITDKVIRTVGSADERFGEDVLRVLRAVRFSCEMNFAISYETLEAISKHSSKLGTISHERIRDEFIKIIMADDPMSGISLAIRLGLNKFIVPELEEGVGCEQKGEHIYDVFEHILHALGHAAEKKWPLEIRLAALFHDIGKPKTRRWDGSKAGGKGKYTFYGHEVVGARMTRKILERLRFSREIQENVSRFVRYHMFFSDTETITLSAVRRTIVNVGREHIWDLMKVRECDRVGMKKKEAPLRLRKYHAMIEEALRSPTSVGMLKIDGKYLIEELHMKPGPRMGWILHAMLDSCLDDDSINTVEKLSERAIELDKLDDQTLKSMGEAGKNAKAEKEDGELEEIRKKHGIYMH